MKLNKILYYSDFIAYRQLGQPITGADYQHLGEGPVPQQFKSIKEELINENSIEIEYKSYFNTIQQRVVAKRSPSLKKFSKAERYIVDEVLRALKPFNATEVSDLSHKEYGWLLTDGLETIPYASAFFSSEPLTAEQEELGKQMAEENGLLV